MCENARVDEHVYFRIQALRPEIRREWESLLRNEPSTPLGHPDALVFLMDRTLDELTGVLLREHQPEWARHPVPDMLSLRRECPCGENPLLCYFSTGELAIRAVAGPSLGPSVDNVLSLFRAQGRHEIMTLCSLCLKREVPLTERRPASR